MDRTFIKKEDESGSHPPAQNEQRSRSQSREKGNSQQRQKFKGLMRGLEQIDTILQQVKQSLWKLGSQKQENVDRNVPGFREAEGRILELEAELYNSQARLSTFLPNYQLSDTSISEELLRIQHNVSNWAEDFPNIVNFKGSFQEAMFFTDLSGDEYRWLHADSESHWSPQSEVVTGITFQTFWAPLFEDITVGPSYEQVLLKNLLEGVSLLDPKDEESIDAWRSDTIRAYTSSQKHKEYVLTMCSELAGNLRHFFNKFSFEDTIDKDHIFARLTEQMIVPAADLAIRMSRSPERYRWMWHQDDGRFPEGIVRKGDLKDLTVMDVKTHNKVSQANFALMPNNAPIGCLLLVIYPALFRCGREGRADTQITKATILVHLNEHTFSPIVEIENSKFKRETR